MNPADPRISEAIQKIAAVYVGQKASHAYYDPAKQLYVLVVSGEDAEGYHVIVKAIHDLAASTQRAKQR